MAEDAAPLTPREWVLVACWVVALVAVPWATETALSAGWALAAFFVVAVGLPAWGELRRRD